MGTALVTARAPRIEAFAAVRVVTAPRVRVGIADGVLMSVVARILVRLALASSSVKFTKFMSLFRLTVLVTFESTTTGTTRLLLEIGGKEGVVDETIGNGCTAHGGANGVGLRASEVAVDAQLAVSGLRFGNGDSRLSVVLSGLRGDVETVSFEKDGVLGEEFDLTRIFAVNVGEIGRGSVADDAFRRRFFFFGLFNLRLLF